MSARYRERPSRLPRIDPARQIYARAPSTAAILFYGAVFQKRRCQFAHRSRPVHTERRPKENCTKQEREREER